MNFLARRNGNLNQDFGLAIVQNQIDPATLTINETLLEALSKEQLVTILAEHISNGLGRRLERDLLFFETATVFEDPAFFNELCASSEPPAACTLPARTQPEVYQLVLERVVEPEVVKTWPLVDSIFNRSALLLEAQRDFLNAEVTFRSWLTRQFITNPQSSIPELAGGRACGDFWLALGYRSHNWVFVSNWGRCSNLFGRICAAGKST